MRLHYLVRGYRVLAANWYARGGELDLVVRRGNRLVFCEVKAKSGVGFGDPLEMVGADKQRRVVRVAEQWLARHPDHRRLEVAFEVAAVRGRRVERVAAALEA